MDLAEAPQDIEAVGADADDDRFLLDDGFMRIPEATRFDDSAPGEGLGEEVEDDVPVPTMIGQAELAAGFQRDGEVWGGGVHSQHARSQRCAGSMLARVGRLV